MSWRAANLARSVPRFCARALLGSERPAIHRPCQQGRDRDSAAAAGGICTPGDGRRDMKMAATDIQLESVTTAYDRWAPVYDLTFGAVFRPAPTAPIPPAHPIPGPLPPPT